VISFSANSMSSRLWRLLVSAAVLAISTFAYHTFAPW
jgi:hypothetical protein